MTIQSFIYPKPDNWTTFETFCLKIFRVHLQLPHLEKFALSGQRQFGVDLVGTVSGRITGIQCKLKNTGMGLTQEAVDKAIEAAKEFTPLPLSEFIIATTAERNRALQQHVLQVSCMHATTHLFHVSIYFWQDIEEILKQNSDLAAELYPTAPASTRYLREQGGGTPEESPLIVSTIEEVAHNLELLVADLQVATTLYFDAHDVYQMILGIDAFVHGQSFLVRDFNSRNTLAQCIAAAGWYSTIRMLPMHQVELNHALVPRFALPDPGRRLMKAKIARFLEASGIPGPPPFDSRTHERWAQLIRERVGDAERLFKCTYCIRSGPPRSRFLDLMRRGIVAFDEAPDIVSELVNRKEFLSVKAVLDEVRPGLTLNNFADASAIALLVHEIERYDRGTRATVPLFFASSPLFMRVAEQSGIVHQLCPKNSEVRAPVFRDSTYLILRAIFLTPESFGSSEELEVFRERLRSAEQLVHRNRKEGRRLDYDRLEEILEDIQSYKFFENVWLPTMAEQDTTWIDLTTLIGRLEEKTFQDEVGRAVEEALRQLEMSVKRYGLASSLWGQLERKASWLREETNEFTWKYELLPLGLSGTLRPEVLRSLRDISQERDAGSIRLLVSGCLEGRDRRDLISSVAILWVMRIYKEILAIDALFEEEAQEPSWLVIKAATLLQAGRNSAARETIDKLETLTRQLSGPEKAKAVLGLAFLLYQQFILSSRRKHWDFKKSQSSRVVSEDRFLLEKSAGCSKWVFSATDQDEDRLFALAQYLMAQLELPEMHLEEAHDALSKLKSFEVSTLWLPQYSLVIARYYHRKALAVHGSDQPYREVESKALLRRAIDFVEPSSCITKADRYARASAIAVFACF